VSEGTWVQGDTGPDYVAVLSAINDPALLDLTEVASLKFQMRKPDDRRFTVNAPASVVGPPTNGRVRYQWGPNDLAYPGEYDTQIELVYIDGQIQTQALPTRITVRRK
jgi:hypothetical protein